MSAAAAHDRTAPSVRLRTPASTARALRAHFAAHNRSVLLIAAGTAVAAAAAWMLLYVVSGVLLIFAMFLLEFPNSPNTTPHGFGIVFSIAAVCAVAYVWVDRRLTPHEFPSDQKGPMDVLSDFLLAIPRMTLSIGGTLAAWQRLSDDDLLQAAALLHRLAENKRLPMSSVRLDVPDPEAAMRVLFGLQITQVVELRRDEDEFWLKFNALRPDALRLGRETYADA